MSFEDVETDLSCLEMDVRVEDLGHKGDFRWIDGVVLIDLEAKSEPSLLIGCFRRSPDESFPVEQVIIDRLEQNILVLRS